MQAAQTPQHSHRVVSMAIGDVAALHKSPSLCCDRFDGAGAKHLLQLGLSVL